MQKDIRQIVAGNLRFFMGKDGALYRNANALGKAAGISPNSIRNLLDPKKRPVTTNKPDGYPTLDLILKIAKPLGCEVWELLHPDIQRSIRERIMYHNIERDMIERIQQGRSVEKEGEPQ